ncbi:hypothetical protein [Mycolicibacter sinensis]|jgi:hypothetical protein|uniref:Secreted protein n=1 Tax=Mycolicibacter sinensis (strain JDM601) TaxID=875328 RepID=A0A1A2ENG2_MYCSD|nr:hypothetical protein [Mycolicibacter sinensis]OBG04169.1 hypothetical protein A5771_12030 [Mycolicibacter sinensis]OBG06361.1 hypothetical protein A5772_01575 [Mycolicibacter sinensis]
MPMLIRRVTQALALAGLAGGLLMAGQGSPVHAQPAGFPNLDDFTAVPVDDYLSTGPKGPGRWVNFATPYNIACQFDAIEPPAGSSQAIMCDGDMPGMANAPLSSGAPVPGGCVIGTVRSQGAAGLRLNRESTTCGRQFSNGAFLGVGQKVSYGNVTCAVGADQLVACLDTSLGHHGFVLRPAGSSAF